MNKLSPLGTLNILESEEFIKYAGIGCLYSLLKVKGENITKYNTTITI
jgi:hypothetical protein